MRSKLIASNGAALDMVRQRVVFHNRHMSIFSILREADTHGGVPTPQTYTAYSYGEHFPMYVYDYEAGQWIGNKDKYSRTTSKHQFITRPSGVHAWVDTKTLIAISEYGVVNTMVNV